MTTRRSAITGIAALFGLVLGRKPAGDPSLPPTPPEPKIRSRTDGVPFVSRDSTSLMVNLFPPAEKWRRIDPLHDRDPGNPRSSSTSTPASGVDGERAP